MVLKIRRRRLVTPKIYPRLEDVESSHHRNDVDFKKEKCAIQTPSPFLFRPIKTLFLVYTYIYRHFLTSVFFSKVLITNNIYLYTLYKRNSRLEVEFYLRIFGILTWVTYILYWENIGLKRDDAHQNLDGHILILDFRNGTSMNPKPRTESYA